MPYSSVTTGETLIKEKKLWSKGTRDYIYNINDALGRAAFLRKDYPAAGDYLLKAADTSGDAALAKLWAKPLARASSFERRQKEVVLIFLERCKAFGSKPQLNEWISVIKNGGTPEFGTNIRSKDPVPSQPDGNLH